MAMRTGSVVAWGQPAWTAAMYRPSTGRDHRGLASVSQDRILPALSAGINVLTVHPRYWSFYVWLLTEFWERELPRTQVAWGRFLKPRERIFVAAILSCSRHGPDIPEVAGKRTIGKELQRSPAAIAPTAYYLKNNLGGYPIYASAISQIGFTLPGRDTTQFQCDAPTDTGRTLGLTVHEWVSSTRYYQTYFDNVETSVPVAVIAEYAELICLCRLTDGPDHPLVQQAFLHGGEPADADIRRMSLRLVCDLSDQTTTQPVSQWNFRQLFYYRSDDNGRSYQPSQPDLVPVARRWRLYQHREFVAWTYNRWLQQVSLQGLSMDGDRVPAQLSELVAAVDDADFASLASALGIDDPHLTTTQPLNSLLDWVRTAGKVAGDLDDRWDLTAPLSEASLVDHLWNLDQFGDDVTAAILTLLALSAARLWPREYEIRYAKDWGLVRAGGTHRLSVQRLLNDMRDRARRNSSIGDTGRWFLEYYVIRQHHRVALGKLPDDTFRLRFDSGRVRFVDEPVAVEMNDPAIARCQSPLRSSVGHSHWTRLSIT